MKKLFFIMLFAALTACNSTSIVNTPTATAAFTATSTLTATASPIASPTLLPQPTLTALGEASEPPGGWNADIQYVSTIITL